MPADADFAVRLAYVRWLRNRGRVKPETDTELAAATGVPLGWLVKWKSRPDAPRDRPLTAQLASALAVDGRWLFDNIGDAPEPAHWREWLTNVPKARVSAGGIAAPQPSDRAAQKKRRGA